MKNNHSKNLLNKKKIYIAKWLQRLDYYKDIMQKSGVGAGTIYNFSNSIIYGFPHSVKSVDEGFLTCLKEYEQVFNPVMSYLGLTNYFRRDDNFPYKIKPETTSEIGCYRTGYLQAFVMGPQSLGVESMDVQFDLTSLQAWASELGGLTPTTSKEELCFRKGFKCGLLDFCEKAGISLVGSEKKWFPYMFWSEPWLFKIGTPPGESECENLPEPLKGILQG